jgi:hypothetical protein
MDETIVALAYGKNGTRYQRAGTTTPFWWGASISASQANYHGNYAYGGG